MQLMWVSGPTNRIHTVSITQRGLLIAGAVVVGVSVLIGIVLHFIGLQIAIQVNPQLIGSLGGFATREEQAQTEASYRLRLMALEGKLQHAETQITTLQALKERFARLADPNAKLPAESPRGPAENQKGAGGPELPWRPPGMISVHTRSVIDDLRQADGQAEQVGRIGEQMIHSWQSQLSQLEALPTALPVGSGYSFSSGFGSRTDPITGRLSRHDGLDLRAPPGTPVFAAGSGRVLFAGYDGEYGYVVSIDHQNGLVSRYAHAREIHVNKGDTVQRGQRIAEVGNTGRSTGPHLHFEVLRGKQPENPARYLRHAGG